MDWLEGLEVFVIYDHPLDYPFHYVIRKWAVIDGKLIPEIVTEFVSMELQPCQEYLRNKNLKNYGRDDQDDYKIIEKWA